MDDENGMIFVFVDFCKYEITLNKPLLLLIRSKYTLLLIIFQ